MSGAIIAPTSVILMCYALYMFKKRTALILRREMVKNAVARAAAAAGAAARPLLSCATLRAVLSCCLAQTVLHAQSFVYEGSHACLLQFNQSAQVRYDDQRGPTLLTLLLIVVTLLAIALSAASIAW